jgi:phosphatidylserine/phosphatidylglycerophosphate/cardiolipin synthase-like enzyme
MSLNVKAYANADDILVAWEPTQWDESWVGFQLERRDGSTGKVTVISNRIPPTPGQGPVQPTGISSAQSPIRRCIWSDYNVVTTDGVSYRVTPMTAAAAGGFSLVTAAAADWTPAIVASGDDGGGVSAYFNRGTLMSQVVSRFVNGDVTEDSLHTFLEGLKVEGSAARRYLAGDALPQILGFLRDVDVKNGSIYAAIYEINDQQLIDALKPFGSRGHVLIGNGSGTDPTVAAQLTQAGLEVRHRDLSKAGRSSPSVHNKFVVEADTTGAHASRVLTGSTNWTTTGLCTQLNNVLIVDDATIADRFRTQWDRLVAAGDNMPATLVAQNTVPTQHNGMQLFFAATKGQAEFKPVLDLIAGAKQGILFLMFMPGQSPLLEALLGLVQSNEIYVRGVVSSVTKSKNGDIASVAGQVVKSGSPPASFRDDIVRPAGVTEKDHPSWEETEFNVKEMLDQHLIAIVHSKAIVIDPFSADCAVITGSHNFSVSASEKNDENLVIVRGNQKLAQAYAVHINGVYDHYSWRVFLANGGDSSQIYKALDGWHPGGSRAQELAFWMNEPMPAAPQAKAVASRAAKGNGRAAKGNGRATKGNGKPAARAKTSAAKPAAKRKSAASAAPKKAAPRKTTKKSVTPRAKSRARPVSHA